jgi:hypothetical protein
MNWSRIHKSKNNFTIKKKNQISSTDKIVVLKSVEDDNDWTVKLDWIAATGTKKGFEKAKRASREFVIKQNGKIIKKMHRRPSQELLVVEERSVKIGTTTILDI